MQVIVVYDTATDRNPAVLRTCRKYLRWAQRSVFHGELSQVQLKALESELAQRVDPTHDSVIIFAVGNGATVQRRTLGVVMGLNDTIV